MQRTQISLTEAQMRALRAEALRRGLSMAALIREAIDAYLSRPQASRRRALQAVGRFSSGRHDISEEHDRELEEAYADTGD